MADLLPVLSGAFAGGVTAITVQILKARLDIYMPLGMMIFVRIWFK